MRKKLIKSILVVLLLGGALWGGKVAFLELYYYRDHLPWLSPLPAEHALTLRNDALGKGHFGARRRGGRRHKGVDLKAEMSTPVLAAKSGWVQTGEVPKGMGKFVILRHRGGFRSTYGHLSEVFVGEKKRVRQGELLGAVGKTGNADSKLIRPHLHFEIRQEGVPIDPMPFLMAEEDE